MIIQIENKYLSICDDCGTEKEVQRQTYLKFLKNKNKLHLCNSCKQKGNRNHQFNKPAWNKGLTKETDERVRLYNEKQSITKQGRTPWNKGRSYIELKGEKWANLFSLKLSQSKKGIPNVKKRGKPLSKYKRINYQYISKIIRERLRSSWTKRILERDNFLCITCGSKENLEAHHLIQFVKILKKCAAILKLDLYKQKEFTREEIELLYNEIEKEHTLDIGITLCKKCHQKIDKGRYKYD